MNCRFLLLLILLYCMDGYCSSSELIEAIKNHKFEIAKQLIEKGADLKATDSEGKTALHWAVDRWDKQLFTMLMQSGADPSAKNKMGRTPLHECAGYQRQYSSGFDQRLLDYANLLLQNGADPDARTGSSQKETALMLAADQGADDIIRALVKAKAKLDLKDDMGRTALHHAVLKNANVVRSLVEAGASVNIKDDIGQTALMLFASEYRERATDQVIITRLLIDAGAEIEHKDNYGQTVFMLAVRAGNREISNVLIKAGVDTSNADFYELLNAIEWGDLYRVSQLTRKVDVNRRDVLGITLLQLAAKQNSPEIVSHLIQAGAKVDSEDEDGLTPLLIASDQQVSGSAEIVRILLKAGADPNHLNSDGQTALSIALDPSNPGGSGIPEILIENGTDPKLIPAETLLSVVWHGKSDLMESLLNAGVDPNKETKREDITLLSAAVEANRPEMVRVLVKRGAMDNRVIAKANTLVKKLDNEELQAQSKTPGSLENVIIKLKRTSCEGTCPDYELTIMGDGRVEYFGNDWVDITGTRQYRITQDDVRKILIEAEKIHFFEHHPKEALIQEYDASNTTIGIQAGIKFQTISDGTWPESKHLADKIDELSGASSLIHTTPEYVRELARKSQASMSPNCSNSLGNAIQLNRYDLVRAWAELGCDFNLPDKNGYHPLNLATDNLAMMKLLIDYGAVPTSDLFIGADLDLIRFLLAQGAKPPLNILLDAAQSGDNETIRLLIDSGADVNVHDERGNTPLLVASGRRNPFAAELLVKNKADVHAMRNDGLSPLVAVCTGLDIGTSRQNADAVEIVKALLEAQPTIQELNSALICAARNRDYFLFRTLLNGGADPTLPDANKITALNVVVNNGYNELLELINTNSPN